MPVKSLDDYPPAWRPDREELTLPAYRWPSEYPEKLFHLCGWTGGIGITTYSGLRL